MYFNSKSIQANKIAADSIYNKGSVTIKTKKVNINWNSYTKRDKNLWV